jgi:hypothetical protein
MRMMQASCDSTFNSDGTLINREHLRSVIRDSHYDYRRIELSALEEESLS